MKCVVPLAGPDLWMSQHGWRPLVQVEGCPLLLRALMERPWRKALQPGDYIFVLRELVGIEQLVAFLDVNWPGCKRVMLSGLTRGAMFSVLAGMALCEEEEPVIVDLADILFTQMDGSLPDLLSPGAEIDMIVPVFDSLEPCFSYLEIAEGRVLRAREKCVISRHASAGVYAFRNTAVYMNAAAWCIRHADEEITVKGVHFVCPMVNGVRAAGGEVIAPSVLDAVPISKIFHDGEATSA